MLMLALMNLTEPSAMTKLAPPGCMLLNPFDAAPKRQPRTAFCHPKAQAGSAAGNVLELKLMGMVVPAVPPFSFQKLLSAAWTGRTSPSMIELLVPSVTLAIFTDWSV